MIVGLVHIEWNCIVLPTTIPNNGRTAPMNVAPQDNNPIELPLLKLTVPELNQDESTDEEVVSSRLSSGTVSSPSSDHFLGLIGFSPLREGLKKNCEKAVRLTAWVDPPLPSPEAVRKM